MCKLQLLSHLCPSAFRKSEGRRGRWGFLNGSLSPPFYTHTTVFRFQVRERRRKLKGRGEEEFSSLFREEEERREKKGIFRPRDILK